MITLSNYFNEINRIGVSTFPETLSKSHDFVLKSTNNGSNWETYNTNATVKKVVDLYLSKLNEFLASRSGDSPRPTSEQKVPKPYPQVKPRQELPPRKRVAPKAVKAKKEKKQGKRVENIREEVKFIKRYVGLHNKVKSPSSILSFIKALQRSIVQKLIRKTSPLAKDIETIQDKLVNVFNKMKGDERFEINEKDLGRFVSIAGGEEVYPSIKFIKRFIGMQERELTTTQIGSFLKQLENAVSKKKIMRDDPYADKLNAIYKKLKTSAGKISLTKTELNGLEGIVKACGCHKDLGKIYKTGGRKLRQCMKKTYSDARKGACSHNRGLNGTQGVLTAEQMGNRQFERLNFNYPWDTLMGKPAKNFTIMFHGEPGAGKTTLLLKFAEYLANNFGSVIYISSEEHEASTLTDKVNELLKPKPANLAFSPDLKTPDLSQYDFIILDSVNDLGLKLDDFKKVKKNNPNAAFILILQHTKDGDYRGGKDWEHDIQIAAKVENGVVTVYRNRYGVKGSLDFFNQFNTKPIQTIQHSY